MENRSRQILLIATFLPTCWLAFQMFHEMGHILAGWASGGLVTKVVLYPLSISRTDVSPNPYPMVVVWAGPLIGTLLPVFLWVIAASIRLRGSYLFRFFAGFCLVGNGAYIGCGGFARIGDAGTMLTLGCPLYVLCFFGIVCVAIGILFWNGLGTHFGLGNEPNEIDPILPYSSLVVFLTLFLSLFFFSPR